MSFITQLHAIVNNVFRRFPLFKDTDHVHLNVAIVIFKYCDVLVIHKYFQVETVRRTTMNVPATPVGMMPTVLMELIHTPVTVNQALQVSTDMNVIHLAKTTQSFRKSILKGGLMTGVFVAVRLLCEKTYMYYFNNLKSRKKQ